jgi:hypothetical protein
VDQGTAGDLAFGVGVFAIFGFLTCSPAQPIACSIDVRIADINSPVPSASFQ